MNYLELIVGFSRWKEVNPLPASAIALWHELVATCNKAGWPEDFTVPNAVLQANAGVSRKEFDRARQILIEQDLIAYKKSNRVNNAGRYKLVRLFKRSNDKDNSMDNGKDNETSNGRYNSINKDLNINKNINKYAEFVSMSEVEYQKLLDQFGDTFTQACITELDNYKGASGKKYKSDYRAILKWVVDKVKQKNNGFMKNDSSFADLEDDDDYE